MREREGEKEREGERDTDVTINNLNHPCGNLQCLQFYTVKQ
jgi:hypothetical protein